MSETPKIVVTEAITTKDVGGTLVYPNLPEQVKKQALYEHDRWQEFLTAQDGSIEEQEAATQLANQYLLQTALKGVDSWSAETQDTWIDRFTKASIDLYDAPEATRANTLLLEHISTFEELGTIDSIDKGLLQHYLEKLYDFVDTRADTSTGEEQGISPERLTEVATIVKTYFETKYTNIAQLFAYEDPDAINAPAQIAEKFAASLPELTKLFPGFEGWRVEVTPNKDSLAVVVTKKVIQVGESRRPVANNDLVGLFFHEVMIHALRSARGSEIDDLMRTGLPRYSDGEEGLGTFVEYAMTGVIPDKNSERYIDIALALGTLNDGEKMPRAELLDIVMSRELLKAQAKGSVNTEVITRKVQAHVNRIYRGTPGEDTPGVFTKDIVYQTGFDKIALYISDELQKGTPIDDLMDYLLSGKFDPTNDAHESYVRALLTQK